MASVQIADLSAYLRKVRTGEEVIICDRKTPVAKIVPLSTIDFDLEEQELIAKGLMLPPRKPFDADAFFAIGRGIRRSPGTKAAIDRAIGAGGNRCRPFGTQAHSLTCAFPVKSLKRPEISFARILLSCGGARH